MTSKILAECEQRLLDETRTELYLPYSAGALESKIGARASSFCGAACFARWQVEKAGVC